MLLFVAAEAREFLGLVKRCRSVARLDWPIEWARSGELNGREVALAANGAGARLAAQIVDVVRQRVDKVEAVVSTGFCGALDDALKIGDVFVATRIESGKEEWDVAAPRAIRACATGAIASIDRVAQTTEEKRNLRRSGALAVEMEAAGVVRRVREWGMPFFCIRSVTDLAGESFRIDFNAVRDSDGRFSTPRILAAAMRRPFTVGPELFELRRRSVAAAQSLGEFIADCSF